MPLHSGLKIGFLASHGGSSMKAILQAIADQSLSATACVVISNNSDAPALANARTLGIPSFHLSQTKLGAEADVDHAIAETLEARGAELVVLSGYLRKLGPRMLERYRSRILNIHPALLPRYGGRGMYGRRVHEAVIAAGERTSGITIHLVDQEYDRGPLLAQQQVPVEASDTPATLAERIEALEPQFFVETMQHIVDGTLKLPPGGTLGSE
jgi:phosphoribosylglycinamide formyltransferase 1